MIFCYDSAAILKRSMWIYFGVRFHEYVHKNDNLDLILEYIGPDRIVTI